MFILTYNKNEGYLLQCSMNICFEEKNKWLRLAKYEKPLKNHHLEVAKKNVCGNMFLTRPRGRGTKDKNIPYNKYT